MIFNKNSNDTIKKTTLDKKHKEKVLDFDMSIDKVNTLKKELEKINNRMIEIGNIEYVNYSQKIISEKANLNNKILLINKEIKYLDNNTDEILYYNNTIDYILPYYETTTSNTQHLEILDFFNKSNIVNKKQNINKAQLLDNYLKATENKQTKVSKSKKFKPKYCRICKDNELTLHLSEGKLICTGCGYCEDIIMDSDKPNYKDPIPDVTAYAYKRINHFNEWLAQFQAKESTDIPEDVYEIILVEIRKQRLLDNNITPRRMRVILKKLGYNKYYEHVQHIINKVSGVPPPKITREVEEKFRQMFKEAQEPFTLYCPKDRKNFLSYSYTLHKFCQLLELDDFLPCFPLLKSRDKLKEQDRIWKKICEYIGWEFISSS